MKFHLKREYLQKYLHKLIEIYYDKVDKSEIVNINIIVNPVEDVPHEFKFDGCVQVYEMVLLV